MLRYHKANPTAGMTPAADYAAEQVGSISYKTLLKHFPLPLRWEAVQGTVDRSVILGNDCATAVTIYSVRAYIILVGCIRIH